MTTKNRIVPNVKASNFKSDSPKTKAANIRQFYNPNTRAQRSDAGKKRK